MKRHKNGIVFLLALAVSATVVSVTATAVPRAQAAHTAHTAYTDVAGAEVSPEVKATVMVSADFTVMYESAGQLTEAAALVVRGEVTQVSYVEFNSTAYTNVTLRVSQCLKGDVAAGDEITIAEVGGVTSMAAVNGDKFGAPTAKDAASKVRVLLEGAPLSEVGDKCLYFLGLGSIGVVPGTYYVPLGAFQGRFKVANSLAERFVPAGWGAEYTSLSMAEDAIDQTVLRAAPDR
jgi:hypothetical protein